MSDAVTTPAVPAAPSSEGGGVAPVADKQPADVGAQMRLHLAKRQEERADAKPDAEVGEKVDAGAPDEAPDGEDAEKKPDEAEPDDEAKPHWAKKLKGELEAAHKKVAEFDGRMKNLTAGARAARDRIADLTVTAEHHAAYAKWLEQQIDLAGYEVPQVQRDLFAQKLELATLKAAQQRGQSQGHETQVEQIRGKIVERARAVIGKFPELDPQKNPEARAFWQATLAVSPDPNVPAPKLDDLEKVAEAWTMVRRGQRLMEDEAKKKAAQPQQRQAPKPTVAGQRGTTGRASPQKQQPITAKTMHEYLARKRAARGA